MIEKLTLEPVAHPGDHDVFVFFCLLSGTHLGGVCTIVEGEEMEVQTFSMSRILGSFKDR